MKEKINRKVGLIIYEIYNNFNTQEELENLVLLCRRSLIGKFSDKVRRKKRLEKS